jgi:L-asparaginase/Glu-tRNA(Gln) amidotransferase subunit D
MQTEQSGINRFSGRTYTNVALTAVAVLLGLLALDMRSPGSAFVNNATAQPGGTIGSGSDDSQGLVSASEQRKQMITELKAIASRLERVESQLGKGLNVKVTSMPQSKDNDSK